MPERVRAIKRRKSVVPTPPVTCSPQSELDLPSVEIFMPSEADTLPASNEGEKIRYGPLIPPPGMPPLVYAYDLPPPYDPEYCDLVRNHHTIPCRISKEVQDLLKGRGIEFVLCTSQQSSVHKETMKEGRSVNVAPSLKRAESVRKLPHCSV